MTLLPRPYEPGDLEGRYLVVAATELEALNASVAALPRPRSLLCNVVDDPAKCTVILPAIHRQGPISSPSRPGARRRRSRSGSATGSPPRSGPRTPTSPASCARCDPGPRRSLPTYDDRKAYFEQLVERALS